MKASVVFTILALTASAASAADDSKAPPKPAEPAKPAPAAPTAPPKKERKTSPEAEAALKRYAGLLHFPSGDFKKVEMKSHCEVVTLGGEVGCAFTVQNGDVVLDVTLPEAFAEQAGSGQVAGAKKSAAGIVGRFFKPFIVPADAMAQQYDLATHTDSDTRIVEMTRFADGAAWDKATLVFGPDGLLRSFKGIPNVDPDDQMAMASAGVEIETTFDYKLRGSRSTIEGVKIVDPMGETTATLSYYEIEGRPPLPKELSIASPLLGDMVIAIHDFVLDGKPVAGTERKAEGKSETPPAKKPEPAKPAEPVKPAK